MKSQFLVNFPYMDLVVVAELLFLAVFLSVLLWTFRRNGKAVYDHFANLPLEKEGNRHE